MDRLIEKKLITRSRVILLLGLLAVIVLVSAMILKRSGGSRLSVDSERISIATVTVGEFSEYYPFDGTVEPEVSIFLDLEQGGQVEEIYTDGGQWVEAGTPILKLSNTELQRSSIETETRLLEQLDNIANSQFRRTQDSLMLKDQLLDLEYMISELEKTFRRYEVLFNSENNALTREEYEAVRDELEYRKSKRDLLKERILQEEILAERQLARAEDSEHRINRNLDLLTALVSSLEVTAPISGHLSSINAQIGQNINRGERIGQIDLLDAFKIKVGVDQYYASDIGVGTRGRFRLNGREYPVEVSKIYPEVLEGGQFFVDAEFVGGAPENIRRGQTLTVELIWGAPEQALQVRKGGFYQQTGGRWAYLVTEDGRSARKVDIRLGRQNPQSVEVLGGLGEGDHIITSSYGSYNEIEVLEFSEPVN